MDHARCLLYEASDFTGHRADLCPYGCCCLVYYAVGVDNVLLCLRHPLMDAVTVHQQFCHPAPVLRRAFAGNTLRDHGYMIIGINKPGVVFLRVLCRCPASASAAFDQVVDDAGHILPDVCHCYRGSVRLQQFVLVADLCDDLFDRCVVFCQRYPAHRADRDVIDAFACCFAQVKRCNCYRYRRFAVVLDLFVCPPEQLFFCSFALVCFCFFLYAVDFRVPAYTVSVNVQVVFADRVQPCIHPAFVNRHFCRLYIPAHAEFCADRCCPLCNVQCERIAAHVIAPPASVQGRADSFYRAEQIFSVEIVWICDRSVTELAKNPVALPAQDIFNRLLSRACCRAVVPGNGFRRNLAEHQLIPQAVDGVFQLDCPRFCFVLCINGFNPPYDTRARFILIQQPFIHNDIWRSWADNDCRRASPLRQVQREAFRLEPCCLCQAVPVQQCNH